MRKRILLAILFVVLVLSLSVGVVSAKKPDKPPGRPVEEQDTFTVSIHDGDAVLITTVPPHPVVATSFDVITYVEDWDYIYGVAGGDPRERYGWEYWDGAWEEPMIAYGLFDLQDKFRTADGYDLRPPETTIDGVTGRLVQMLGIGHGVNVDRAMDWCYVVLQWERELATEELVTVSFGVRSNSNSEPEIFPTPNDGDSVESWTCTLYIDEELNTNTEFQLRYYWYETELVEKGKSGKFTEESVYHHVNIWTLDGGPQPTIPITISATINRPIDP